jgi:hypothetical protein
MGNNDFDSLPWNEIEEISKSGIFEEVFKRIPRSRLEFVAKEENKEILVRSAKRKLMTDSHENAEILAELMQEYARRALEWKDL